MFKNNGRGIKVKELLFCPQMESGAVLNTSPFPDGAIQIFHWQSLWPHYDPGVDSSSNRYEYQEYFLEVGLKAVGV